MLSCCVRKALILKHARVSVVDLLVSPKNFLCWPLLASTIVLECIFTRQLHSFAMNNRLATSRSTFLTDVRPGKKQSMVENPNSPGRARRRAGPTDTGTLSTRGPTARRPSEGKGTVVLERTGITYVYFYTTFDERTTKRRAGSPAARSSSEFSTALAGGRGAASASDASRSQARRGGSSAPQALC